MGVCIVMEPEPVYVFYECVKYTRTEPTGKKLKHILNVWSILGPILRYHEGFNL